MVYFLIPVYNEEGNVEELCAALTQVLPEEKKHFVFVNDCSTDRTCELIQQSINADVLTIINNPINSVPGYSFNAGLDYILSVSKDDSDNIITMEGDNTSDLAILPVMNNLAKQWNFDLVLASVYAQGGGFSKTSWYRKVISFIANQILRFAYDIKVLTLSSFYRVYKISILRKVKVSYQILISENGFICMLEILIKIIKVNGTIVEVPMILNSDKRLGKSKMKILKTSWQYFRFLLKKNTV